MSGLSTVFVLSVGILVIFSSFVESIYSNEDEVSCRITEKKERKIAFNAHLSDKLPQHIPSGTTIIFPKCTLNDGNGYNSDTGIFTTPLAGVYMFTAHVCNGPRHHMVFAIMKDNIQLARSTTYENNESGCGSVSTIAKLQRGDQIKVTAKFSASYIWAEVNRVNSFSGFYLYQL